MGTTGCRSDGGRKAMRRVFPWLLASVAVVLAPGRATAQDQVEARIRDLERQIAEEESSVNARIQELENQIARQSSSVRDNSSNGAALFLYGVFCALWAQNTGRSA